jgi:hypothetical protein
MRRFVLCMFAILHEVKLFYYNCFDLQVQQARLGSANPLVSTVLRTCMCKQTTTPLAPRVLRA